jgi:type IV secretory pathway TraG/TraD family ATPase VirD4
LSPFSLIKLYLTSDSKQTIGSIVVVLAANAKPLMHLQPVDDNGYFSIKQYFANLKSGNEAWLFLATKPSSRALTLPLISCLTELALTQLMEIGINSKRRVWIVIDELPALGKLL